MCVRLSVCLELVLDRYLTMKWEPLLRMLMEAESGWVTVPTASEHTEQTHNRPSEHTEQTHSRPSEHTEQTV